ncbi:MAG: methyltransferase domain-containing protein [Planctomycetaceae bacterium]|nr:methyltransferase domain-containing protein [Planctomycetaceae bacterium]
MKESVTSKTYDIWSWFYDCTFAQLVRLRHVRAVQQLRARPGDRILDIGVGTGRMLPLYPKDVTVVGMDLSGGMLAKAAKKCKERGLDHCQLVRADAMCPPFAPASFDQVVITHTISVVSQPEILIQWAASLLKPGGRIILVNHFQSSHPVVAWFEKVLNPLFVFIGWRSDLALEDVLRLVDLQLVDLRVDYRFKVRLLDLWQIIVLTNTRAKPRLTSAPCVDVSPTPAAPLLMDTGSFPTASLAVDGPR